MPPPRTARARSRPRSTAPSHAGSSPASSAAATAPPPSPRRCCASWSSGRFPACPLSCGIFPANPYLARDPVHLAGGQRAKSSIVGPVGRGPSNCPPSQWDLLWLTPRLPLGSFVTIRRERQPSSQERRAPEEEIRAWGVADECAGTAAGNLRVLSPQRPRRIDLRPPRRQR